ncbi:aspartate aminotransferase family protein [Aliiroseovarius subalbicans]|uniref:aspartate aminotransferase family protein n=1 Tax=Aliiroseovarius subalbicans TaxID=2925840 RepID=UPI001F55D21D|nr:aspartate aminotransferase family protein [Aliiroseovarius subalbicans]MCI2399793.1 aspartate aminotransferase family protein [Aliiroseovarius subalbicans]
MSDTKAILERRERLLGPNMTTFYRDPVHLVRGEGAWLWDGDGRRYLDCYNNVPHVGHCHPKVVEAITAQALTLNTHTRYLHEGILDYVERLTATMGHGLDAMIMVCTGSEANDIALRMGMAVTGKTGFIGTDNTYHGNTDLVSQLSSKKKPIGGRRDQVRLVPSPDSLRPLGGSIEGQAQAFADHVAAAIADLEAGPHGFSSLILDPFFANEGFPDLPKGFLDPTAEVVRRAGGVIIADEVQPGFGRTGRHFWGHERIGLAPDIVTMGKPMGNGHPVAGVVARPEVLAAFRSGFGYFNTFGGNPVSAAAAMAVMDVIEDEGLMENARDVGDYTLDRLGEISHSMIADIRGAGMFLGVEFVKDADLTPAPEFASDVVEAMRDRGILLNKLGRWGNALKIRPPLCFSKDQADLFVDTLTDVLEGLPA